MKQKFELKVSKIAYLSKIVIINQTDIVGLKDFVCEDKFLFSIQCLSNVGNYSCIQKNVNKIFIF